MSQDTVHGLALVVAVGCLSGGAYLLAGAGAALCLFGGLVLAGLVFARTRIPTEANRDEDQHH